jgi:hypothetical protein
MFHAAALTLGDVSRTVSRNASSAIADKNISRRVPRGRGLNRFSLHRLVREDPLRLSDEPLDQPRRSGQRGRTKATPGAAGAVRAQFFTIGIIAYASGPVKKKRICGDVRDSGSEAGRGTPTVNCQAHKRSTPMSQRAATIESLPMAFEMVKAMQADGLGWGEIGLSSPTHHSNLATFARQDFLSSLRAPAVVTRTHRPGRKRWT